LASKSMFWQIASSALRICSPTVATDPALQVGRATVLATPVWITMGATPRVIIVS